MAVLHTYETYAGREVFTFRLVDQFAAAAGASGPYPTMIGKVRILVTQRTDIGRVYDPERELLVWSNASGFVLTGGDTLPSRSGAPTLALGAGTYKMRLESDYYRPDEFTVTWPPAGIHEVQLLPTTAYPFPDLSANPVGTGLTLTRGCVFAADGTPKVGAPVSVDIREPLWSIPASWPFATSETNSNGEWVLLLPEPHAMIDPLPSPPLQVINVRYTLDGNIFDETADVGRQNRYLQASLRGTAVDANGRPLAAVKVENSLQAGASFTDAAGRWAFYFPFDQADAASTVKATAPNGHVLNRATNVSAHKTVIVDRFQFS